MAPCFELEAENAVQHGTRIRSSSRASAGRYVTSLKAVGDAIEFQDVPPGTRLGIRYGLGWKWPKQMSLYVEGLDRATVFLGHTGGWTKFDTTVVEVEVGGTVRLEIDPDDHAANDGENSGAIDKIIVDYEGPGGNVVRVSDQEEFDERIGAVQPGDTIVLRDGTWRDAVLGFSARGDLDRPITLRAETHGQVILTGSSRLIIDGKHLVVAGLHFMDGALRAKSVVEFTRDCSFCRLTQTAITNYNPGDPSSRYHWVRLKGRYSRVDHCEFRGQTHSGVTLAVDLDGRRTYHLIDHNHFGGRTPGGANGFETIRIGTGKVSATEARATVGYNYFSLCDGEVEMISNKSNDNVYRNNTFFSNQGQLSLRNGHRARVEGNFFFGNSRTNTSGVRIIGEDHVLANNYFTGLRGSGSRGALVISNGTVGNDEYKQVKNALVAFNTFTDCTHNLIIGWDFNDPEMLLPPVNCTIANNVVVGSHAPLVEVDNEPVDMTWEGNIMFGAEVGIDTSGIQVIDPRLVLAPDGLMRPAPGSPVVGGALGTYPQFSTDMDGQPRPEEAADVGADQRSSAPIGARPLTPKDVGPSWRTSIETAASTAVALQ